MPLKLIALLLSRFLPLAAVPGASFGSGELNRAPDTGVLRSFVSILLLGGPGYEDLRSESPVAFDHRASTVFSISSTKPSIGPRTTTRPIISSGSAKIATRSRWSWLVFGPDEIAVTAEQNVLTVEGRKSDKDQHEYLYQGISARPFKRQFNLADYVKVRTATFDNGLLRIELVREIPRP